MERGFERRGAWSDYGTIEMLTNSYYLPRILVVKLALASELSFIGVSLVWIWAAELPVTIEFSRASTAYGVIACVPMLAYNILVFGYLARDGTPYPAYGEFKRRVVIPLCGNLNFPTSLLLALSSGFAEELFFRGALFSQLNRWLPVFLSVIVVAALFSYVHFIGVLRRYWQVALSYLLFGVYFCGILIAGGDISAAMVAHALYNFCAISYLRFREVPRMGRAPAGR